MEECEGVGYGEGIIGQGFAPIAVGPGVHCGGGRVRGM